MNDDGGMLFIGIDIGTSSVKVLAATPDGRAIASATSAYALRAPLPDRAEQDAEEILAAIRSALRETVAATAGMGRIAALGLSCAMHGVLPAREDGTPLGPVVTWMDGRAAAIADRWHADGTANALYMRTGVPAHPMLPACKVRWFAENEPELIRSGALFVSVKELLVRRWTGEWLVDYGIASGTGFFDLYDRTWAFAAIGAAGIAPDRLARLVKPGTSLRLRAETARDLGVPEDALLVLGSSDGALANLGSGAVTRNAYAVTLGSSGAVRRCVEMPLFDARARTFCYAYDDDRYVAGGATNAGGRTLAAFASLVSSNGDAPAASVAEAVALAESVEAGAAGVSVVPFLTGERAPYWRTGLRGGIDGLTLAHTRAHVVRAAAESIVYGLRAVYDALGESLAAPARIRLSGGLFAFAFFRQLAADVFARPAERTEPAEASAFGAAMFAAIATGALASDRDVAARLTVAATHEPDAAAVERYAEGYARYRASVASELARHPAATPGAAATAAGVPAPRGTSTNGSNGHR